MDRKQQLQLWNKRKWERKNRAMYERFAENKWPWYNEDLDPDIEEFITSSGRPGMDILDLGTCSGSQAIELAKRGHSVVGTEVSETALARAEAAAQEAGLSLHLLIDDITDSALEDEQFDLVLDRGCYHSICCFHHDDYVVTLKRILKPGGVLLIKTMSSDEKRFVTYDNLGDKAVQMPFHFAREQLRDLFSPHFEVEDVRDSYFFSKAVSPPAQARLAIVRKPS